MRNARRESSCPRTYFCRVLSCRGCEHLCFRVYLKNHIIYFIDIWPVELGVLVCASTLLLKFKAACVLTSHTQLCNLSLNRNASSCVKNISLFFSQGSVCLHSELYFSEKNLLETFTIDTERVSGSAFKTPTKLQHLTWNQGRLPPEFKHINKGRKRNQQRFP